MTSKALDKHTEHVEDDTLTLGFWIYLMTDCVLFATLFAAYAVLRNNTFGGPSGHDLFHLPFVLAETVILLTSSYTSGLAMLAAHKGTKNALLAWLAITLVLGGAFLTMELSEFQTLLQDGNGWQRSAFLSSFFTLLGAHGLHILAGSVAMFILMIETYFRGLNGAVMKKLACLSLFWHFLDVVWIFIFTLVYLIGAR
jgi:cytochrome o ubiquinol oxidase subunit 3